MFILLYDAFVKQKKNVKVNALFLIFLRLTFFGFWCYL